MYETMRDLIYMNEIQRSFTACFQRHTPLPFFKKNNTSSKYYNC